MSAPKPGALDHRAVERQPEVGDQVAAHRRVGASRSLGQRRGHRRHDVEAVERQSRALAPGARPRGRRRRGCMRGCTATARRRRRSRRRAAASRARGRRCRSAAPGAGRGRAGESPSATSRPRGGSSPRRIARTIDAYSRISATGLSIVWPCQPSTTGRCETPRPRFRRPSDSSSIVAAVCAIVAGVRV